MSPQDSAYRPTVSPAEQVNTVAQPTTPPSRAPDARGPMTLGHAIGPYTLWERIGRGGLGDVYRAFHAQSGAEVALKLLRAGDEASPAELRSFQREVETARKLSHSNILPILDAGEHDGQPYYTMPVVAGGSLAKRMAGLDLRAGVSLLAKVARAVHAAHQKRIIHRDLKPANILLDVNGEPLVADFGLARFLDQVSAHTMTGAVMGSLPYMSPEQAAGKANKSTPATDVWALGVMLYELLAGTRPFVGESTLDVLHHIQHLDPPALSQLRADVPRDLEAVCLRCLRKEPLERYQSTDGLAHDLERWLAGEAIEKGTPPSPRWTRWLRRRPSMVLLPAALAVFVSLTALAPSPPAQSAEDPDEAARARLRAALALARPDKPVELLSLRQAPRRATFVVGEGTSKMTVKAGRPTWVNTPTVCLLELLPADASRRPYRLTIEMAHIDGEGISQVGAYVAHRARAGEPPVHGFVQATYCEPPFEGKPPGQPDLALALACFVERPDKATSNHRFAPPSYLRLPASVLGKSAEPFRTFCLEIGNDRAGIALEGRPPRSASRAELELGLRLKRHKNPDLAGYRFDISPQGAAGLVIWRGAVLIRRVEYQPLPPGP